jgi:hypothetical protein
MKKKFSFIVALLFSMSISWATTYTVGPGGLPTYNYATIQAAIDAAFPGDVIKVFPGTYNQDEANGWDPVTGGPGSSNFNIFVNKSLTIQGVDGTGTPITDYDDVEAYVAPKRDTPLGNLSTIFVQADNVIITGLDVTAYADPDKNFKTISVIGENCTIKYCNLHNLDQVSSIYLYDPRYNPGTNVSYLQSYLFEGNYLDAGGINAAGIRISSGPGWTGAVANRVITGNTFYGGSYGIEFVGPGADPWDVYPVGAATVTSNSFSGLAKGAVVAWGTYAGAQGYGSIDWNGIFNTNGNIFDKATMVTTTGGQVRYYDVPASNFYYIRGIYSAIQRYPLNWVAQPTDLITVKPGTYVEQVYITTNNLTIEGAGKANTIIKAPATALSNFFMIGALKNCPVVYLNGVANCSIKNLTVDGDGKGNINYRFQGIGFYNAGGTIQNVDVLRIWDTPFSGAQHGVGVYSYSTTGGPYNITCKNMLIDDYQKNATAFNGLVILDIDNITTQGQGPTGVTAQNGIQAGPDATGTIKNCNIHDVQWTGYDWTSTGLLLYGDVNVSNTTITGCQTSVYSIDANNSLDQLTITAPVVADTAWGIVGYSTSAAKISSGPVEPSPFDYQEGGGGRATSMVLNVNQSKINGNNEPGSMGIQLYSLKGLTSLISKCKINDWEYGIYAAGDAGGTVTATVHKCDLGGNTYGFVNEPGTLRAPQDATDNWWGDESGPHNPTSNPDGLGSEVSDYVNFADWITDPVDIYISNPECGMLYVVAVPSMPLDGQVTNILFAVRWENLKYPDSFFDISSDYNVTLQYYALDGIYKYAVFGTDLTAIDWDATVGDTILSLELKQNQPEGTISDFVIADDPWTEANNADYYFEFWGSDLTGAITGFADDVYLGPCDLQLHVKVFLQGPYNTTSNLMNLDLNTNGLIPLNQPFNVAPWNYAGSESLTSIPADMVDWVLVELRPTPSGTPIRQAGLLFNDGTVRSAVDSFFDIYYTGAFIPNSDYYVAIFQRNHMPVMSLNPVNIPNTGDVFDFSDVATYPLYGGATAEVLLETGVHGMIAGDINNDGDLIYSGFANDRALILQRIVLQTGQTYINGVCQGYYGEDLTMNSWVKYSGSGNDQRLIILNLIELTGTYNLNATYASLVPGWGAKAMHVAPGTGPIDIALVENSSSLDVVLVTNENIPESWADNIQFTLSWDKNNLMMDQAVFNFTSNYNLEPQGEIRTDNGRKYMTFVVVDWIAMPAPFNTGDVVTVLSLNKGSWNGVPSKAAIARDGFTLANNGGYYVSLIGQDNTGQVLETMTGIDNPAGTASTFKLYPNPATQGYVTMSLIPSCDETLAVTVTDLSSRIVSTQQLDVRKGQPVVKQISLDGLSKGIYFISLQGNQTCKSVKVEIQ